MKYILPNFSEITYYFGKTQVIDINICEILKVKKIFSLSFRVSLFLCIFLTSYKTLI